MLNELARFFFMFLNLLKLLYFTTSLCHRTLGIGHSSLFKILELLCYNMNTFREAIK